MADVLELLSIDSGLGLRRGLATDIVPGGRCTGKNGGNEGQEGQNNLRSHLQEKVKWKRLNGKDLFRVAWEEWTKTMTTNCWSRKLESYIWDLGKKINLARLCQRVVIAEAQARMELRHWLVGGWGLKLSVSTPSCWSTCRTPNHQISQTDNLHFSRCSPCRWYVNTWSMQLKCIRSAEAIVVSGLLPGTPHGPWCCFGDHSFKRGVHRDDQKSHIEEQVDPHPSITDYWTIMHWFSACGVHLRSRLLTTNYLSPIELRGADLDGLLLAEYWFNDLHRCINFSS